MPYIENPKTKGSGIVCCIPQKGTCPNKCSDCFFQSGRSYLEPLEKNLPNIPPDDLIQSHVVRVNDGNDSANEKDWVIGSTEHYPNKFYNTAIPVALHEYPGPVVLTINPRDLTDREFWKVKIMPNLMFVRFRVNTWNTGLCWDAVNYYTEREIPIVLTFMAYYHKAIPERHLKYYTFRKRTLNSYWAITTEAWDRTMHFFRYNKWVYSCGKIEGEKGTTLCRYCGNCLREYYATMERMRNV